MKAATPVGASTSGGFFPATLQSICVHLGITVYMDGTEKLIARVHAEYRAVPNCEGVYLESREVSLYHNYITSLFASKTHRTFIYPT